MGLIELRTDIEMKLVLGIDPGTTITGWAVVGAADGEALDLESGHLIAPSHMSGPQNMGQRLHYMKQGIDQVLRLHPDIHSIAYEGGFIGQHAQSNMAIGYGRALALLAAGEHGLAHAEYAPATIKKRVANSGRATKSMLTRSIASLFNMEPTIQEDESDAIGVALTHLIEMGDIWFLR